MQPIVLASSSPYRKALLARLGLPFTTLSPDIDESPLPLESPEQLVKRLAEQKALAVRPKALQHIIIASDQVASIDGKILTKPCNHQNAINQLTLCSNKTVTFYTGLALLNTRLDTLQSTVENYVAHFRRLNASCIERYLRKEQPYDCAGSFKMEGLGISLFEKLQGDDPNTLMGLPLIKLVSMLAKEGIEAP